MTRKDFRQYLNEKFPFNPNDEGKGERNRYILDEYADMDPRVWPEVIRPALSDRKGWAVFIGTPKATKRAYGDYLWFNDRPMFENDYREHLEKSGS